MLLRECLLLVAYHRDNFLARILPWIEPLLRESVDTDYDGRWLAQTRRVRSSSFSAKGTVLLLAGSGRDGLAPARRVQSGS
jgi:hypothetical protein